MRSRNDPGFALIITLALLALLVLCVFALSALVRVNGQISTASAYQTQARQNALLGLHVGLGELQRYAGLDTRITGMAGIAGVPGGSGNGDMSTRYWCGVWEKDGTFLKWLASGAGQTTAVPADPIELIGAASVGASGSTSANVEKQHVVAGRLSITVSEVPAQPGVPTTVGNYAFVVTDEGGKISAYSPPGQLAISNVVPVISDVMLSNQLKLKSAIGGTPGRLPQVLSYEQLAFLPSPALTASVLQDTFHYVTLTARSVNGSAYATGTVNINTASTEVWRCLLDTYNSAPGVTPLAPSRVTSNGNAIGNGFAASSSGKAANGPFLSVSAFGSSTLLSSNLTNTPVTSVVTPVQFTAAVGNLLTVRSDTFRVRAYGDAINPINASSVEATAYCEAIVQRTPDAAPNGLGRRFVITYFRWLGPDDI